MDASPLESSAQRKCRYHFPANFGGMRGDVGTCPAEYRAAGSRFAALSMRSSKLCNTPTKPSMKYGGRSFSARVDRRLSPPGSILCSPHGSIFH
jgi:hypothetical protein